MFGFFGITDVRFVRAEGIGIGDAAKANAIASAEADIRTHTAEATNEAKGGTCARTSRAIRVRASKWTSR